MLDHLEGVSDAARRAGAVDLQQVLERVGDRRRAAHGDLVDALDSTRTPARTDARSSAERCGCSRRRDARPRRAARAWRPGISEATRSPSTAGARRRSVDHERCSCRPRRRAHASCPSMVPFCASRIGMLAVQLRGRHEGGVVRRCDGARRSSSSRRTSAALARQGPPPSGAGTIQARLDAELVDVAAAEDQRADRVGAASASRATIPLIEMRSMFTSANSSASSSASASAARPATVSGPPAACWRPIPRSRQHQLEVALERRSNGSPQRRLLRPCRISSAPSPWRWSVARRRRCRPVAARRNVSARQKFVLRRWSLRAGATRMRTDSHLLADTDDATRLGRWSLRRRWAGKLSEEEGHTAQGARVQREDRQAEAQGDAPRRRRAPCGSS